MKLVPQFRFALSAVSTTVLTFVAITPCRLVDTRGAAAGFNGVEPFAGPAIPPGGTLTIPVQSAAEATTNTAPAPCGEIPAIAQAYSFNVTLVPSGPIAFVSLWPAGSPQPFVSTLNDLQGGILANSAIVPAGAPDGSINVFNEGPATTHLIIDMNGYFAAPTDVNQNTAIGSGTLANNTTGQVDTATGAYALSNNTSGAVNTADGAYALYSNTMGDANTAIGADALYGNTTGANNTASGDAALASNTTGSNNTATGGAALSGNTIGANNTASGGYALLSNTTGANNTAIGQGALQNNSMGDNNIAVGVAAAGNVSSGLSNNIHIGSSGNADDSGAIRIGTSGTHSSFFVAGVIGVTTGISSAIPVVIDSNGQLGTVSSSRRFKEDIQDMGDRSSGILRLRPVTFRYTRLYQNGSKPLDYGLIAEEVAQVYPDLVVKGANGLVETVQYQKLTPMLLNEVQKQQAAVQDLEGKLNQQRLEVDGQGRRAQQQDEMIRQLEARLGTLEASLKQGSELATTVH